MRKGSNDRELSDEAKTFSVYTCFWSAAVLFFLVWGWVGMSVNGFFLFG